MPWPPCFNSTTQTSHPYSTNLDHTLVFKKITFTSPVYKEAILCHGLHALTAHLPHSSLTNVASMQ